MKLKTMMLATALAIPMISVSNIASAYEPRVDGSWFESGNYGGDGDMVVGEVKQQQKDYYAAAKKADDLYQEWTGSNEKDQSLKNQLIEAQQACVKLATFSWVRAQWRLELGRLSLRSGDIPAAKAYYSKALADAETAESLENVSGDAEWLTGSGESVVEVSHTQGAKAHRLAQNALDKIGQ